MKTSKTNAPIVQLLSESMAKPIVDTVSGTVEYRGYAPLGTPENSEGWVIERKTVTGTVTKYEYAQGSMNYEFKWSERLTYTYSR